MSPWEFMACVDGWQTANGTKKKKPSDIADERLSELGIEGF
ncbi:hypothetical protein [Pseudohoeflea suaedae]|nr:hypothetical protein [Pseudohoeflea suaedae]